MPAVSAISYSNLKRVERNAFLLEGTLKPSGKDIVSDLRLAVASATISEAAFYAILDDILTVAGEEACEADSSWHSLLADVGQVEDDWNLAHRHTRDDSEGGWVCFADAQYWFEKEGKGFFADPENAGILQRYKEAVTAWARLSFDIAISARFKTLHEWGLDEYIQIEIHSPHVLAGMVASGSKELVFLGLWDRESTFRAGPVHSERSLEEPLEIHPEIKAQYSLPSSDEAVA